MIVSLGVHSSIAEHVLSFVTKPLTPKLDQVVYHATLRNLISQDYVVHKLIIPGSLHGCDYNFEKLIEHIRIDQNKNVARIPIIVFSENEDEYLTLFDKSRIFSESFYEQIAVSFPPENPKTHDFITDFDEKTLKVYLNQTGKLPYSEGSHDKTNAWGSFVVLRLLNLVDRTNETLNHKMEEVQNVLLEETYYKKLIQSFEDTEVSNKQIYKLNSARLNLKKILSSGKILIIEDQLKEGWRSAYESIFSVSTNSELCFVEKENDAEAFIRITPNIDLILLDVRLASDRGENNKPVEELSGVKLAAEIRKILPTVPIIAATASNKSWTLEALLERGINSYWVKGSPDLINNIDLGIENVVDLYKKINTTLEWSQHTGHWQKELYRIADVVGWPKLLNKAKSLQALLHRSFSPFSKELSKGLQMNLAFLEIYSCMNDLTEWVTDIEPYENGEEKWHLQGETKQPIIIERKKYEYKDEFYWEVQNREDEYRAFPDANVFKIILIRKKLAFQEFDRLRKIRNGLPLVHGNIGNRESPGSPSIAVERVNNEDINSLVRLLASVVDHHAQNYLKHQADKKVNQPS